LDLGEQTLLLFSKKSKFSIFLSILAIVVIVLLGSSESIVYSRVHDTEEFYNVEEGASFNSILEDFELPSLKKILLKIYFKKMISMLLKLGITILKINRGKILFPR
jgi:hypothetical protein